jgi:adenylate kinase
MRIILLGPPGAGKGTQAAAIKEVHPVAHISTGDILRENVRAGTELGREAKGYMDAGSLVPDALIIKMMAERLNQPDARESFLLDGFPRTVAQAVALDELTKAMGIELDAVILLDIGDDILVRRLTSRRVCSSCGAIYNVAGHMPKADGVCDKCSGHVVQRDDDMESVIRRRLDVYRGETAPLVDYYDKAGKLRRVEATGPANAVLSYLEFLKV